MKSNLKTSLLTPEKIFADYLFRIPDYQRGYSWEDPQRSEFLEDLELLPPKRHHYTGTLVLHNSNEAQIENKRGESFEVFNIVDGQQRLTTIILLLNAIRREFLNLKNLDLAEGLTERYMFIKDRNNQPLPKLTLNRDCHAFFLNCLSDEKENVTGPAIRSHQNILDASKQFESYLQQKRKTEGAKYSEWLDDLRGKVCQQLAFTVYTVDEASDVGVIFEVMNDRGLQITNLEKVKNYLLYLSSKLMLPDEHNLDSLINNTWSDIFEILMNCGLSSIENEDQLLRMHWIMAYDYNQKNWKGSKSIKAKFHLKNYINKHDILLEELKIYITTLKDAASLFCDIHRPERTGAFKSFNSDINEIVKWSEKLRRLKVLAPFIPLLMAIRFRFPQNSTSYLQAVKLCENYSFRTYRFLKRRTNAGQSTLYLIANALYNKDEKIGKTPLEYVSLLLHQYSPQESFLQEMKIADTGKDWYHRDGLKYLLYEYEEHLAKGKSIRIPWSKLESDTKLETIEHILPQTPETGYWTERFNAKAREKYTHDIGNLCLTSDNSSYGRKSFTDKKGEAGFPKPCYATGLSIMERNLCEYGNWTETELLNRREKIISWLTERWPASTFKAKIEESADNLLEEDEPEDK